MTIGEEMVEREKQGESKVYPKGLENPVALRYLSKQRMCVIKLLLYLAASGSSPACMDDGVSHTHTFDPANASGGKKEKGIRLDIQLRSSSCDCF